jgi:hypothetical protein
LQEHPKHYQWSKSSELHAKFQELYPFAKCSLSLFQRHKPYYVRRGTQQTCLCTHCENMRLMKQALDKHQGAFEVAYSGIQLQCSLWKQWVVQTAAGITSSCSYSCRAKVRVAESGCSCTVLDLIGLGKKSDLLRAVLCQGAVDDLNRSCMGHGAADPRPGKSCDNCKGGESSIYRDRDREEAAWGKVSDFDAKTSKHSVTYMNYKDDDDKADNELHNHVVHPSVFLDLFTTALVKYGYHYCILKKQKAAHQQLERNFIPGQLLWDYDFAENFTIINGREIQSAYWVAKQVTMFIGVSQHLCHTAWATVSGKLARGQEVSVQSTPAGYRFALVDAHADGAITEDSDISLVDEHGTTFSAKRRDIRTRKIVTIAHNGVSNDMKHDTWMVQVRGFPLFSELRAAHRYLLYCSTASH